MTDKDISQLKPRPVDHLTSVLKSVVGLAPIAGPFLSELVGVVIPNQRVDRLADFTAKLNSKIKDLEAETLQRRLADELYTDLLEESLQQVVRSTSEDRREYIANLVTSGINDTDIEFHDEKHLLKMLGELNDVEVIWLIAYAQGFYLGQESEFHQRHANILKPVGAHLQSSQTVHDQQALQEGYKLHLERLGLLKVNERGSYDITPLGRLLVRKIGMEEVA